MNIWVMSLQEKVERDVLSGLLEELTDGLDQQYVLFGCLGGNAEAVEIQNAIEQCFVFRKKNINGQFVEKMGLEKPKKAQD